MTGESAFAGVLGFQSPPRPEGRLVDLGDGPRQVGFIQRLHVHVQKIGAGIDEPGQLVQRVVDHEMHVAQKVRGGLELLQERHAHGEVRHEVAVHDVDVDEGGAALLDHANVPSEVHEIGGQD